MNDVPQVGAIENTSQQDKQSEVCDAHFSPCRVMQPLLRCAAFQALWLCLISHYDPISAYRVNAVCPFEKCTL